MSQEASSADTWQGGHAKYPKSYFKDFDDTLPSGHPPLHFNKRGKLFVGAGQVWVQRTQSQELWVIARMQNVFGKTKVYLRPYGSMEIVWTLSETTLRKYMRVWEEAVEARQELHTKLARQQILKSESSPEIFV